MLKKRIYAVLFIFLLLLPKKSDTVVISTATVVSFTAVVLVIVATWNIIKKYLNIILWLGELDGNVKKVEKEVKQVEKEVVKVGENVELAKKDVGEVKTGVKNVEKGVEGVKTDVGNVQKGVQDVKVVVDGVKIEALETKREVLQELSSKEKVLSVAIKETEKNVRKDFTDRCGGLLTELETIKLEVKNLAEKKDVKNITELVLANGDKIKNLEEKIVLELRGLKSEQEICFTQKLDEKFGKLDEKFVKLEKNNDTRHNFLTQLVMDKFEEEKSKFGELIEIKIEILSKNLNRLTTIVGEMANMKKVVAIAQKV